MNDEHSHDDHHQHIDGHAHAQGVVCPKCGHVQADAGPSAPCAVCGYSPMPTHKQG